MTTTKKPQTTAKDIFDLETGFADLGLDEDLLKGIEKAGFEHPTHVQAKLIPSALSGRDVLGQSRTGTGKTAAFGLPVLQLADPKTPFSALIVVPTRELAIQVTHELRELGRFSDIKCVAVYGGQRMHAQTEKLKKNPQIIIGTPGRLMDMHRRGHLRYDNIRVAVLDEVDRMLDIGFREDIRRMLGAIKQKHQTIFVSATISPEIDTLARRYMNNPERLTLSDSASLTVQQVKQTYFSVQRWDKKRLLLHLLKTEEPGMTLIFCRTKLTVDALTEYLARKKVDAHAIHGNMYQAKRNRVMTRLRAGELHVLVCSDLAARGLDVDDITHVINFDVPEDPEIYVHRIGRTARAGRGGEAWMFVTPEEGDRLTDIEMLTNSEIPKAEADGFTPGPIPRAVQDALDSKQLRDAQQRQQLSRHQSAPPADVVSVDDARFPGGIAPKALPNKRMGGRVRTRRGR